jgi:hypothetical protein
MKFEIVIRQSLIVYNPRNGYFTPSIRMLPITVFGMKHHS